MLGKSNTQNQRDMFRPLLLDFINLGHELVLLANKMDWGHFERELGPLYSSTGQPGMPVRFSVGCLLLKRIYDLGDETLAKAWVRDPYMQYFTGQAHFCHKFPCDPSDFVHFRKRIGEAGVELIFAHSVSLHGKDARSKTVMSDTTVQENNTTFPTDAKLAKKVIDRCNKIAGKEGVVQRQSYKRVSKQLLRDTHNAKHPKRAKKARRARGKLRTIAGRLIRELRRKLPEQRLCQYQEQLERFERVIAQQRSDKDKIYSLHKPHTACIAKGKAARQYEFGNKVGIMATMGGRIIITAVEGFCGNPNDGRTIEPLLQQHQRLHGRLPEEVIYDRGAAGSKNDLGVKVSTPKPPLKGDTDYRKRKKRKKFRRRAAIEPVIGHLKKNFRMQQNYLMGEKAPKINAMLAATGWNLKKLMEKLQEEFLRFIFKRLTLTPCALGAGLNCLRAEHEMFYRPVKFPLLLGNTNLAKRPLLLAQG